MLSGPSINVLRDLKKPTYTGADKQRDLADKCREKRQKKKGWSMGINQGPISLDQKYTQSTGHVFMTGIQALVRLPMAQIRRDRASGLNTAGFISGYRGSPLGGYDQQLFAARKHLEQYNIRFQPGVNEDLAATAIWGSQQLNLSPGASYDGVVGIWYGKGPGVDRC